MKHNRTYISMLIHTAGCRSSTSGGTSASRQQIGSASAYELTADRGIYRENAVGFCQVTTFRSSAVGDDKGVVHRAPQLVPDHPMCRVQAVRIAHRISWPHHTACCQAWRLSALLLLSESDVRSSWTSCL